MTLARNEAERYMREHGYNDDLETVFIGRDFKISKISDNLFKHVGIVPLDNVVRIR